MKNVSFRINKFLKLSALVLALLICALSLASCKARPLSQTKLSKTEVGKVGDYSVLYEELYFLASNYTDGLRSKYANDPEGLKAAVWDEVYENITENYAILELCRQKGLIYDEDELREDVETSIELDIVSEYDGSRSNYFKSQQKFGLTDHYVRFITGINVLYASLATEYREDGIIPTDEDELISYIQDNFAHTWHIAVFINSESERDAKMAKIEAARKLLTSGTSMYELIGSEYNEDVTPDYLSDAYGYYFPKGIMDKAYEDAAFSLAVGDNAIVETTATNNEGKTVPCIYLIERLSTKTEASKAEIESNLSTLSSSLADAIINDKKEEIKATLKFVPNEYALSLDITALEPATNGIDYQLIIVIAASVVAVVAVAVALILISRAKTKRFQNSIKKYSAR